MTARTRCLAQGRSAHASRTLGVAALALALALLPALGPGCSEPADDEPKPPVLSSALATPWTQYQGNAVLFSVVAKSPQGSIATVTFDLSTLVAGLTAQPLYDDGTNGDAFAGDDTWSFRHVLASNAPPGSYAFPLLATDDGGLTASAAIALTVMQNFAPTASNGTISRDPVIRGARVLLTVDASDPDDSISTVTADLAALGGSAAAVMRDDGTNGDATAADGTFSLEVVASESSVPGTGKTATFTATDTRTATATASVTFEVSANIAPRLQYPAATPPTQAQRLDVLFTVDAYDADGLASVVIDLSAIGVPAPQAMVDDGTNGDATSGDGTWSFRHTLSATAAQGNHALVITATDLAATPESNWTTASLYVHANNPPTLGTLAATPNPTSRNQVVLFTAGVSDGDGFVQSVTLDLTALGGTASESLYDNGSNGDATAGDGTWSRNWTVPASATPGSQSFPLTATDDDGVPTTGAIPLQILTNIAPTVSNPLATPNPQQVGLSVLLTVSATDDAAVVSVTADLSALGGTASDPMYDDGTHGDATASDGTWSLSHAISGTATLGTYSIPVTATDAAPASNSTAIPLIVSPNQAPSITSPTALPALVPPARTVTLTASVADPHGVSTVTVNLSVVGRSATQAMFDDGTNGDATSGDGVYTVQFTAGWATPPGLTSLSITATDALSVSGATSATVRIARYKLEHAAFLEQIHGTSASNMFVVGNYGEVAHYDGTAWRLMDARPGSNTYWYGVHCESATSVWIGGASGRVSGFDGKDWTTRDPPGAANYDIRAFWADGAGKVYAVGGEPGTGTGNHEWYRNVWDNSASSWGTQATGTGDDLNDIFGTGPSDIVAVGDDGLIQHWNGTTWATQTVTTQDDFYGVWGYNNGTASLYWASAGRIGGNQPNIYYYNGSTWTSLASTIPGGSTNLKGIFGRTSGTSLSEIFVVGTTNYSLLHSVVWRSTDGTNFSQVTSGSNYFPDAPYRLILSDCWIPPGSNGTYVSGHRSIQHYVSTNSPPWTEDSQGTYEDTRAVDVFSSTRWLTWDHPNRPTGGTNPVQGGSNVHHVSGTTRSEYRDNTGNIGPALQTQTMLDPPSTSQTAIAPRMYAMRMFSASDCYAVGDDGHVYYWNGQTASGNDFNSVHRYGQSLSDLRRLYALWGLSSTDFWFGGEGNRVYHFATGSNWSTNVPAATILPGTARFVTGIWGSSNTDVYAVVGDKGLSTESRASRCGDVFHFTGSSWVSVAVAGSGLPNVGGIENLNAVWGTSSSDVFIAGDAGFIYHYDGSSWSNIAAGLGSPGGNLNAVFGDSSEMFVAGAGMTLWHRPWVTTAPAGWSPTWTDLRANGSTAAFLGGDFVSPLAILAGTDGLTVRLEK